MTADTEVHTLTSSGAAVLVLVCVESLKVDHLSVDDYAQVVSLRCVPTVDLVEVECELDRIGIARDLVVGLEWVSGSTIILSVTSKELGEDGSTGDLSVSPSEE